MAGTLGVRIVLWPLGSSVDVTLAGEGDSVKVLNGGMTGSDFDLRKTREAAGKGCWIGGL